MLLRMVQYDIISSNTKQFYFRKLSDFSLTVLSKRYFSWLWNMLYSRVSSSADIRGFKHEERSESTS